jgi:hypothetical protein
MDRHRRLRGPFRSSGQRLYHLALTPAEWQFFKGQKRTKIFSQNILHIGVNFCIIGIGKFDVCQPSECAPFRGCTGFRRGKDWSGKRAGVPYGRKTVEPKMK